MRHTHVTHSRREPMADQSNSFTSLGERLLTWNRNDSNQLQHQRPNPTQQWLLVTASVEPCTTCRQLQRPDNLFFCCFASWSPPPEGVRHFHAFGRTLVNHICLIFPKYVVCLPLPCLEGQLQVRRHCSAASQGKYLQSQVEAGESLRVQGQPELHSERSCFS